MSGEAKQHSQRDIYSFNRNRMGTYICNMAHCLTTSGWRVHTLQHRSQVWTGLLGQSDLLQRVLVQPSYSELNTRQHFAPKPRNSTKKTNKRKGLDIVWHVYLSSGSQFSGCHCGFISSAFHNDTALLNCKRLSQFYCNSVKHTSGILAESLAPR